MDVEFEMDDKTLALLGVSGCGKSMTLKCIAGIETPDEGRIVLNGRVLFDKEENINLLPRQRKVGLLFQNYALFPNMTLEENIAIGIPKHRKDKKKNQKTIEEKITSFSLEGLEKNYPHQLSGGQQQRVALARMLVNEPDIIMLDEPFSALDEHLRWRMEEELISLLKEHKSTSIYVSHNRDEVYRICDRIAVLNDGSIEEFKEKEALFKSPKTINTAILTGCKNTSPIEKLSSNKVFSRDWNLELTLNKEVDGDIDFIGIRAHDLKIRDNNSSENTFELKIVDRIKNMFSLALVFSDVEHRSKGSNNSLYVYVSQEEFNSLKSKDRAYVELPKDSILLLKKNQRYKI